MIPRLLLVDDDLDEQFLNERALSKLLPAGSRVLLCHCGHEAIRYLVGEGKYADRAQYPFPTLLITDLNMPDGDGLCLLDFMQQNTAWSVVPRIVYSCSRNYDDVRTAYMLGASAFHLKPVEAAKNDECLRRIIEYWATTLVPPVGETGRLWMTRSAARGERYPQPCGGKTMAWQRPQES